jgi:hypothetical protein
MPNERDPKYNMGQTIALMEFFVQHSEIWRKEMGDEFFTRDHWFVFNECCRSYWENKNFTISDAVRTMPLLAPTVARTRIEEAEKAGFFHIKASEKDHRTKLVLPTDMLKGKVRNIYDEAVDLFRDTLDTIASEGPMPKK